VFVLKIAETGDWEQLGKSLNELQRTHKEAMWNAKYLNIMQKPFRTLAFDTLEQVLSSHCGNSHNVMLLSGVLCASSHHQNASADLRLQPVLQQTPNYGE
jgi:hypothetical protein